MGVNGRLRFGQFDFDPREGALWRDGRIVRLQPQPARVLALLTARAGEIVTRDELRREVWGDGTFVDFERGLNFCVAQSVPPSAIPRSPRGSSKPSRSVVTGSLRL